MNEIQTFNFKNSGVRTFVDENGNPWFCAKDVCDILGYKNSRDAVSRHTKSEGVVKRDLVKTLSNGRQQGFEMTFIDERNVYRLVLRSEIPDAEPFQDWVCGEVLPTIRKTGSYGTPQTPVLPDFTNPAIAARAWAEQYEKNQALQAQILLEAPKVQAAEDFLKSDGDHITNDGIYYIWNRLKKEGHIPEGRQLQLELLKEAA
jgi:prophage antirepressor-like protein